MIDNMSTILGKKKFNTNIDSLNKTKSNDVMHKILGNVNKKDKLKPSSSNKNYSFLNKKNKDFSKLLPNSNTKNKTYSFLNKKNKDFSKLLPNSNTKNKTYSFLNKKNKDFSKLFNSSNNKSKKKFSLNNVSFKSKMSVLEKKMKVKTNPANVGFIRLKQQKGLKPWADFDGDGLANIMDCNPLDKNKQGFVHKSLNLVKGKGFVENDDVIEQEDYSNLKVEPYNDNVSGLEVYGQHSLPKPNMKVDKYNDDVIKSTDEVEDNIDNNIIKNSEVEESYIEPTYNNTMFATVKNPESTTALKNKLLKQNNIIEPSVVEQPVLNQTINVNRENNDSKLKKGYNKIMQFTGIPKKIQAQKEEDEWRDVIKIKAKRDALKEVEKLRAKKVYKNELDKFLEAKGYAKKERVIEPRSRDYRDEPRTFKDKVFTSLQAGATPFAGYGSTSVGVSDMLGVRAGTGAGFAMMSGIKGSLPFSAKIAEMVGNKDKSDNIIEVYKQAQKVQQQMQPTIIEQRPQVVYIPESQRQNIRAVRDIRDESRSEKFSPYSKRPVIYTRGPYKKHK